MAWFMPRSNRIGALQYNSEMAADTQQFGTRQDDPPRRVNEVNISSIDQRLDKLTSLVEKFASGNTQQVKTCGIYSNSNHPTYMCPTLQEEPYEQYNMVGGFPGTPQRKYDPYSNTYNPGWRDHPNMSYGPRPNNFQQYQPMPQNPQYQQAPQQGKSLEQLVESLVNSSVQFQQETRSSIKNLESQISQLVSSVNKLENQEELPSQTIINPIQNVSAMTLRSDIETNSEEHVDGATLESVTELIEQVMEEPNVIVKEKLPEETSIEVFHAHNYVDPFEVYIIGISNSDKQEILRYLRQLDPSTIFIERQLQEPGKQIVKSFPAYLRYVFLGASYENTKMFKEQSLITSVDPTRSDDWT